MSSFSAILLAASPAGPAWTSNRKTARREPCASAASAVMAVLVSIILIYWNNRIMEMFYGNEITYASFQDLRKA